MFIRAFLVLVSIFFVTAEDFNLNKATTIEEGIHQIHMNANSSRLYSIALLDGERLYVKILNSSEVYCNIIETLDSTPFITSSTKNKKREVFYLAHCSGVYYINLINNYKYSDVSLSVNIKRPKHYEFNHVWKKCWKNNYFDFTEKTWTHLSYRKQIEYAQKYQILYAKRYSLPIEKVVIRGNVKFDLRLVPPGKIIMGPHKDDPYKDRNESYVSSIEKHFWIGVTEVTQEQWFGIMKFNHSKFFNLQNPVENVNWKEVQNFLEKTEFQLPNKDQWEYSCRAGTTTMFNLGNDITPDQVNYNGKLSFWNKQYFAREKSINVRSLSNQNSWGMFDFHGNVREMCRPLIMDSVDFFPVDKNDLQNYLVYCRGGSWGDGAYFCRSPFIEFISATEGNSCLGFRIILE